MILPDRVETMDARAVETAILYYLREVRGLSMTGAYGFEWLMDPHTGCATVAVQIRQEKPDGRGAA